MTTQGQRWTTARLVAYCLPIALSGIAILAATQAIQVLTPDPAWTGRARQARAVYGVSVAGVGDVNGDGYDDVVIGSSLYDGPTSDEGRIFLHLGSPAGLSDASDWIADGNQIEAWLGFSVARAGDVNGDGYDDIIAGAHGFDSIFRDEGAAYVWYGSPDGPGPEPDWTGSNGREGASFGQSVASAGDVNGDGYDDLVIGSFAYSEVAALEGAAYLFLGSAQGPSMEPDWFIQGFQSVAYLGFSVAGAGDVNGDGYDDVLIGAHLHDDTLIDEGQARLYLGGPGGLATSPAWTVNGGQAGALFGHSVAGAGDVNRDGYDDVVIGAPGHDGDLPDEGRMYLFLGSAAGLLPNTSRLVEGDQALAELGFKVAGAGDINRDGYADVAAGAVRYDSVEANEGQVRLYLGNPDAIDTTPAWTDEGDGPFDFYGGAVAGAGDVDGNGFGDLLVGAQAAGANMFTEGQAYLYLGLVPNAFTLRVIRSGNGGGAVSSSPAGIDCGSDCFETYDAGTQVTLQAFPDPGSAFGGWVGDPDCEDGVVDLTATLDCTALFHLETELCQDADDDGFGSPGVVLCPMGVIDDCDDLEATTHPGAPEVCDGLDNNCDGAIDAVDCSAFDANGDGVVDGVELSWIGRSFGEESADPASEWWFAVDYTLDGRVDGVDLGLLGTMWSCADVQNVCE